jgi:carbon monoxide dehydrogenase subunit G
VVFEDRVHVDAEITRVWDLLLDVNRFAACMPGVEQVTQVDDRTFDGVISAKVGPMSGKFSFRAHIVESKPPNELLAKVEGSDSVTKSVLTVDMDMTLASPTPDTTDLAYKAVVEVKGRLAILGDMVLRATAGLLLNDFGKRLQQQLAAEGN